MRLFLDTNILLDVYLNRPGMAESARVVTACGEPWNEGFVAVHTLSNAFYIIERQLDHHSAWEFIRDILAWVEVADIPTTEAKRTQHMGMRDFEDALQIAAAEYCGADVIVTRNLKDFQGKTSIMVVLPENFQDNPPQP
jgi:predicted nucleic acid-binding protein